jgi:hypothetical protein
MRTYRDLWLWLGALFLALVPFPAAIAIAYYAKLTNYPLVLNWWMLVSLMLFLAAFACFFSAIRGFRMPPWKKIEFPDIQVDLYGIGFMSVPRTIAVAGIVPEASSVIMTTESLRFFMVRVTNMEGEQNASLTIRLYAKLVPGSHGPVLETVCSPPDWPLSPESGLRLIEMPLVVEPGTTKGGDLTYVVRPFLEYADISEWHLELQDHITKKRVRIPTHATIFDRKTMVPSSGGIRFSEAQNVSQEWSSLPLGGSPEWPPSPFSGIVRFFRQIFPPL